MFFMSGFLSRKKFFRINQVVMLLESDYLQKIILEGKDIRMNLKKILLGLAVSAAVVGMVGCGKEKASSTYDEKITLGKYKGIEVEKTSTEPTDEEIEAQVKEYLHSLEDKDIKKVKDGDNVNIDFEGKIDGKKFDNGSAEKYNLVIGSNSFIDNFEEQLIGKKVGKKYDIKVTFPKEYPADEKLAGKKAVFTVKINYVSPRKLTDKIVKNDKNNEYKTADEYRAYVEEQLIDQLESSAENTMKSTILTTLVENCKYKDLKKDVQKEVENSKSQIKKQYNMTVEEYAKQMGSDEKTLLKQIEESSETYVKQSLALLAVAEKEDIKLSDKEFNSKVQKQIDEYASANYPINKEEFYDQFGGKAEAKKYYLQLKVLDFLVDKAKVKKAEPSAEPTAKEEESKKDDKK